MRTAIVGGGAAGFFLAVCLKEMAPEMEVTIFEKSRRLLAKVEVSGGGRCNCTNSFRAVRELQEVYPRGHRLMKRLIKNFGHRDAYEWFERHGVRLVTQADECVFPASQDAHTIINCFLAEARRHGVEIRTETPVDTLDSLADYDFIVITTGGMSHGRGRNLCLQAIGGDEDGIISPVPSLFTFNIDDNTLHSLMGTVADSATVFIPGTKLRASGPLLITHWGMSGPAILRLSSYAARELSEHQYQMPLAVNWTSRHDAEILAGLKAIADTHPQKQLANIRPFELPARLWTYLTVKAIGQRAHSTWKSLNQKEMNRLVNTLCNDSYRIAGRAAFKEEFVTCGGVSLQAVDPLTLESKNLPGVFFAGEVLDIDGVTGGFNFQAAWTTAYAVASAIAARRSDKV